MSAIEVTATTKINHAELGAEVWEWDADQQAAFLAAFATAFSKESGVGIMQIHYIAEELRKNRYNLEAVRWLAERLSEYLGDPS
jgi:hypothetical protein